MNVLDISKTARYRIFIFTKNETATYSYTFNFHDLTQEYVAKFLVHSNTPTNI